MVKNGNEELMIKGRIKVADKCEKCNGTGTALETGDECDSCAGNGFYSQ